jgi:hypothetical protein
LATSLGKTDYPTGKNSDGSHAVGQNYKGLRGTRKTRVLKD